MDNINQDLQKKIDALGLHHVDDIIYDKYLNAWGNIGIGDIHYEYYKMYGKQFMPYSKEYLIRTPIEQLLKRDKENYKQFCPSFFMRLKDKYFEWKFKRWVKKLRNNYQKGIPPLKK